MAYQNPWDADKAVFGGKSIALKTLEIRKVEKAMTEVCISF